ncbi:putative zinc ribbon protein [Pantoea agglomerans]
MKCAWVDPEEKARAREKKLRQVVCSVDRSNRPPQEWYCVLWDTAYQGIDTAEYVNPGSIARSRG